MRIIVKGELPDKHRVVRLTCTKCGTLFETCRAERSDTLVPQPGGAFTVRCPLEGCGKNVWCAGDR